MLETWVIPNWEFTYTFHVLIPKSTMMASSIFCFEGVVWILHEIVQYSLLLQNIAILITHFSWGILAYHCSVHGTPFLQPIKPLSDLSFNQWKPSNSITWPIFHQWEPSNDEWSVAEHLPANLRLVYWLYKTRDIHLKGLIISPFNTYSTPTLKWILFSMVCFGYYSGFLI